MGFTLCEALEQCGPHPVGEVKSVQELLSGRQWKCRGHFVRGYYKIVWGSLSVRQKVRHVCSISRSES